MGCFSSDAPEPRNYGQETAETLAAQVRLAPKLYAAESQFGPQYTDLALQNMRRLLQGSPETTSQETTFDTVNNPGGWYDSSGKLVSTNRALDPNLPSNFSGLATASNYGLLHNNRQQFTWRDPSVTQIPRTATTTKPAVEGIQSLLAGQNTFSRQADINDVLNLGGKSREAILAADPDTAALLSLLNAQAKEELASGNALTPEQQRIVQQASRAAWTSRGLAGTSPSAFDEVLRQIDYGQRLAAQRRQQAAGVIALNQNVTGDPFQQILGRSSGAMQNAGALGQQAGPSLFNPESAYAGNIYNSNKQYEALFAEPSTMGKINQVVGTIGNIVGVVGSAYTGGLSNAARNNGGV